MPLAKTLTLSLGYDAEYWRVSSIGLDFENKIARINYSAFKDEDTFDLDSASTLQQRNLTVMGDNFDTYFGTSDDVITQAEAALIALDLDLTDATTV